MGHSLSHYGVKGMHWGVTRTTTSSVGRNKVTSKNTRIKSVDLATKTKLQTTPAKDAAVAAVLKRKAKAKSTDALSNDELRKLVTRMNLEQQYNNLKKTDMSPTQRFLNDLLEREGKKQINSLVQDVVTKKIGKAMAGNS